MNVSLETTQDIFCSLLSLQVGEDLIGSATRTDVYLLLEYNGAWGSKAFEESDIPEAVKAHLGHHLQSIPGSRLLLIRSRSGVLEPGIRFFIARVTENNPALYVFHLEDYRQLLQLDPQRILSGSDDFNSSRSTEPLFLVCTNSRRDACCAKFGLPVYLEMLNFAGPLVWQCTHVGGHRFAANALCFPHGIFYGRLRPVEAETIIDTYRRGQIDLEHYRGRACYNKVVQAADYYLRRKTGSLDLDAFRLIDSREIASQQWQVQFEEQSSGKVHRLIIRLDQSSMQIPTSCKADKRSPLVYYRLVDYQI